MCESINCNNSREKKKDINYKTEVNTKHMKDLWMESLGLHNYFLWTIGEAPEEVNISDINRAARKEVQQCMTLKTCGKKWQKKYLRKCREKQHDHDFISNSVETSIFEWNISCKWSIFRQAVQLESLWWNLTNANICATFVWCDCSTSVVNSVENRSCPNTILSLCALYKL